MLISEMVHMSKEYGMTSCLTFVLAIVLNVCPRLSEAFVDRWDIT